MADNSMHLAAATVIAERLRHWRPGGWTEDADSAIGEYIAGALGYGVANDATVMVRAAVERERAFPCRKAALDAAVAMFNGMERRENIHSAGIADVPVSYARVFERFLNGSSE